MDNIFEFVKAGLANRKLSTYRIAKDSGVPISTVRELRDGNTNDPRISSVLALEKYFRGRPKAKARRR